MNNRNIHVNPNFYSHSNPKIHINPSFVKKVDSFSECRNHAVINKEEFDTKHGNQGPNFNMISPRKLNYGNQSCFNQQPTALNAFKLVRKFNEDQLTYSHKKSSLCYSNTDYKLNNYSGFSNKLTENTGSVTDYSYVNHNTFNSTKAPSTKLILRNNFNKQPSVSENLQYTVNHKLKTPEKSTTNIYENVCLKSSPMSHGTGMNMINSKYSFNHCNNSALQSLKNTCGKSSSCTDFNKNNYTTCKDLQTKYLNLESWQDKKNSEFIQSCIYSSPTVFKSRLKLIRRDTLRKSAKYIREDLLAKKRKYAVKTKTKLVRRNSTNSKCQKCLTPRLSKLRRSLTLRRGALLRPKDKVVFNHSKTRPNAFFKQNKFIRSGSIISKFKIQKSLHSKSKYSSPPPHNKYAWPHQVKRGNGKKLSDKFININGNLYKSTAMSLKKQDLTPKSKKKTKLISSKGFLKRFSLNSQKNSKLVYRRQSSSTKLESGTLIEIVRRKKLANFKRVNDFCFFYNKYGKCKKENKGCPFIHDPNRIAICTRFLQGSCTNTSCPFSHKLDKNKMPACSHFLEGLCSREECLYRHVRVNPGAPVCQDFLKGHCPQGEECKNKHILICEDFNTTGGCSRGNKCPLSHRKPLSGDASKKSKINLEDSEPHKIKRTCKMGILGLSSVDKNKEYKPHSVIKGSTVSNRYFDDCASNEDLSEETSKNEGNASIQKSSAMDLKRRRIFEKLEKIKKNYNVESNIDECCHGTHTNEEGSSIVLDRTSKDFSKATSSETASCDSTFKIQVLPLPNVLPSFIPLEMPTAPQ